MDSITLIIGVIAGAILGIVILKAFKKEPSQEDQMKKILPEMENLFNKVSQDVLKNTSEQLTTQFTNQSTQFTNQFQELAKEKLDNTAQKVKSDLEAKKDSIEVLVNEIRKEIGKNEEHLKKSDNDRVSAFSSLQEELKNYKQITSELRTSTDDLKKLLSNNQLRGRFGEQVAENLLKMCGFVIGTDYVYNKEQEKIDTRPDFTIYLPDKTKINIDVKFPYSALLDSIKTEDKLEKVRYTKIFERDMKDKIKQVTTRDYINPEEKTVDFVILFIPNEMIFSFVYEHLNDVWEDAMAKKVIMAGPFSFTAILRMVKQAYSNFRYQENLHHIIGLIQNFDKEYQKYNESVDKLGDNISRASKQFEVVSGTRTRMLTRIVDQIKTEKIPASPSLGGDDAKIDEKLKLS